MTLMELTGHEAGIICYGDRTVGVYNWAQLEDDRIPMMGPADLVIDWPEEGGVFSGATETHVDDLRTILPGSVWIDEDGNISTDLDIVHDDNNDLPWCYLCTTDDAADLSRAIGHHGDICEPDWLSATVYILRDGRKVIAPDLWN